MLEHLNDLHKHDTLDVVFGTQLKLPETSARMHQSKNGATLNTAGVYVLLEIGPVVWLRLLMRDWKWC